MNYIKTEEDNYIKMYNKKRYHTNAAAKRYYKD